MYVNRRGETIYYNGSGKDNPFLSLSLAGITFPDPEYIIVHNSSKYDLYNCYIFEYIVSGKGYLEINDKKYDLKAGNLYFINKLKFHTYYADKKDPFKKMFIVMKGTFVDNLLAAFNISDDVIIKNFDISDLFNKIFQTLDGASDVSSETLQLIFQLIQSISNIEVSDFDNTEVKLCSLIQNYLDNNLRRDLTLKTISEELHISKSHIERTFYDSFGIPPLRYFSKKKVQYACELLINTNYLVSEISDMLSYSSPKHFSHCVRKHIGLSPMQYRQQLTLRKNGNDKLKHN